MKKELFLFLLAGIFILGFKSNIQAQGGTFIDHGFIPATLQSGHTSEFQSAIYNNGCVFVATTDGIWKNDLSTKQWSISGLQGKTITALFKHPTIANAFYAGVASDYSDSAKTCYLSDDGGNSWHTANNPIFWTLENRYENYLCFAVRPGYPNHIYCNTEGGSHIAISTDGGENWVRMNNMTGSIFGYQSVIAFSPLQSNSIYQGSELPLDDAWLGRYDIDTSNVTLLNNFIKVIDNTIFGNRRPTEIKFFQNTGETIYVGQEGALSKISGNSHNFIYKSNSEPTKPYSYIYAIWVNPSDTNHILFGGALNNPVQPMQLYETYDEGVTFHRYTNLLGTSNPEIREIISTNTYPAILINDRNANKVKLVLFKANQLDIAEGNPLDEVIKIYPTITSGLVKIEYGNLELNRLQIFITNTIGQTVQVPESQKTAGEIDLSGYESGLYYVNVIFENKRFIKKVVLSGT